MSLGATHQYEHPRQSDGWRGRLDFRSPSLELAKIQVSPGFFPNREPSGSVLITCSMAFPTSPEPPVTRITSPLAMIVEETNVGEVDREWSIRSCAGYLILAMTEPC